MEQVRDIMAAAGTLPQTPAQEEVSTDIRVLLFVPPGMALAGRNDLELKVTKYLEQEDGEEIDTISFESVKDGEDPGVFSSIENGDDKDHHLCVIVDMVNESEDRDAMALRKKAVERGWEYISGQQLSESEAEA